MTNINLFDGNQWGYKYLCYSIYNKGSSARF
jgi:hypothetical protein